MKRVILECILIFTNVLAVVVSNYISASQGLFPSVYEQKTPKKDIEDNWNAFFYSSCEYCRI